MAIRHENMSASPGLKRAARRVEELLRLTVPLGMDFELQFGSANDPSDPHAHLVVINKQYPTGADVRENVAAIRIVDELRQTGLDDGLPIKTQQLAFCNSLTAPSANDLFQLVFTYLRQHRISDLTLAPVERLVADALSAHDQPPQPSAPRAR